MTSGSKPEINILVVDDDPLMVKLAVRVLQNIGYKKIDTAGDGNEALGKIIVTDTPYDVIVCDLNMPEMDGVEFMRHVKESEFAGSIILLSGEDKRMLEIAYEMAAAHNLNVLGAISKPLSPVVLEELLAKFKPTPMEKRHSAPQVPITKEELESGITGLDDGLLLYYQPVVHLRSGEITSVETLARWKHPTRGILGPDSFIPLAEETGLIDELTKEIFRIAAQQTADWMEKRIFLKTSVNFSISSFADPEFANEIIAITQDVGIDPKLLNLELTERQVMNNTVQCLETLMRMRFKKFGLSLDDFGTGNSSLEQLKRIPFTEFKIDRTFVHGAANNAGTRAILEACIRMAKSLNMEIVAKGVETSEDWILIEKLACDYVQGTFCSEPLPSEELLELIDNWRPPSH